MFASIRGGSCAPVAALLLALALPGVAPVAVARGAEPAAEAAAGPLEMLAAAKRICVIGDSITYDGRWVSAPMAWLSAIGSKPNIASIAVINTVRSLVKLPSITASTVPMPPSRSWL